MIPKKVLPTHEDHRHHSLKEQMVLTTVLGHTTALARNVAAVAGAVVAHGVEEVAVDRSASTAAALWAASVA